MASENKVLTLAEVLALPEGARVWVEDGDFGELGGEHRAVQQFKDYSGLRLVDDDDWEWDATDRYFKSVYGREIRVWSLPQPPTPEEMEKWPWEVRE